MKRFIITAALLIIPVVITTTLTGCGVPQITWEPDMDNDGVQDEGAPFDVLVHMGSLEAATVHGTMVYVHEDAIGWGGNAAPVYVSGYGFGGEIDWCSLLHPTNPINVNGGIWYGFEFHDNGTPYRVNFTRSGCTGPDGITNWAELPVSDPLVWVNPDDTRSLCFSVRDSWEDGQYGRVIVPHDGTMCNNTY